VVPAIGSIRAAKPTGDTVAACPVPNKGADVVVPKIEEECSLACGAGDGSLAVAKGNLWLADEKNPCTDELVDATPLPKILLVVVGVINVLGAPRMPSPSEDVTDPVLVLCANLGLPNKPRDDSGLTSATFFPGSGRG
jgi:hypothetical protein